MNKLLIRMLAVIIATVCTDVVVLLVLNKLNMPIMPFDSIGEFIINGVICWLTYLTYDYATNN